MNDHELLRRYVSHGSQADFAELVQRHINLVYSAARRMVSNSHLAEDITQQTFILLARKAAQLGDDTILPAWLYRAARNIASATLRQENRRQRREQLAVETMTLSPSESEWQQIEPMLDDAMGQLNVTEHDAVLLRYFENKSLKEVGATLGLSENAAQKRISRAVEQLRGFFATRGVTVGVGGLGMVVSANAVQAAPAGLALTISTAAAVAGTTVATTATATAVKTIAMTTLQKTIITTTVAVLAGAGVYEAHLASKARAQVEMFRQQQAPLTVQIELLQKERDATTRELEALRTDLKRFNRNSTELLKLRSEVAAQRQSSRDRATTDSTVGDWAARTALLKQRIDQMPDKRIPELEFLTEKDWAAATRDADLGTVDGVRQALSALRSAAKGNFLNAMREAFNKYLAQANGGDLPADPATLAQAINNRGLLPSELRQLKPYFDVPVDDATLQRYQLLPSIKMHDNLSDILVKEIAPPVNPEYDTHREIGLKSGGVGNVNLIADAVAAAARDYRRANNGQIPNEPLQITPYLKYPVTPDLVQKYLSKTLGDPAVLGQ